ncbi:MAG: heavy metal-responsive transcriptional regulator [Acidimicrobiia bacterium]|nr:heavy metal-responsive transcriptional regulator [Acidimicrobiia bacterium]
MKIGEIARKAGVATSAIRFYEDAGLLPEAARTASGYRAYGPDVLDRLAFIRAGQAVGLTLGQLREVLQIRDRGEAPCSHVAVLIDDRISDIDQRIEDLTWLRRDLVVLARVAQRINPTDCPPESVCRILVGPSERISET